jgi:actin-related protein
METTIGKKDFIIIDNGSGFVKAGFSGEDTPRIIIPTVLETIEPNEQGKVTQYNLGSDIDLKNPVHDMTYPISRGIIKDTEKDWDAITRIWDYVLRRLVKDHV